MRGSSASRRLGWPQALIALLSAALFHVLSFGSFLGNAELDTLDKRFTLRGPREPSGKVLVLGIDQQSYDDLDRPFPWPRAWQARVLENLDRAGARVVVFDLIFDAPGADPGGDEALARAMAEHGRVVLGVKQEALRGTARGWRLTRPTPLLAEAAAGLGLVDRLEDRDGFTRRYRLSVPFEDGQLYSLGVEALRLYHGLEPARPLREGALGLEIGPVCVPRVDASSFLIDYRGPAGTIPTYSFSSAIDDADFDLPGGMDLDAFELQKEVFRDKIVVVGATLPELQDFVRTPFFETEEGQRLLTPGAEMHANAIESMLAGEHYSRPAFWMRAGILFLLSFLVLLLFRLLRPLAAFLAALLAALGYLVLSFWLFMDLRLVLDLVSPASAMALTYAGLTLHSFILERRERQRIKGMFAKYVPEKVIEVLYENPELMNLGGEERELTVLFSDLAGFTSVAESLSPTELVDLLNDYMSEMTDIVLDCDGIIDKYEGDLIMAEFGAPLQDPDHAAKSCRAALRMQERLAELRVGWSAQGREALRARVGVNTGKVILGNMGSHKVHDYTVLGDAVNLASRLEGANKIYRTGVMISEATRRQAGDEIHSRELDIIRVKGKAQAVRVFELLGMREDGACPLDEGLRENYARGLAAYRERDWRQAMDRFSAALEIDPEDGPSQTLLMQARILRNHPPGEDWDGVFSRREE